MSDSSPKITAFNMLTWGKHIEEKPETAQSSESLIRAFRASRFEGWKNMEKLRLPMDPGTSLPLSTFLEYPLAALPKNRQCNWFVILEPKNTALPRHRNLDLKIDEIIPYVEKTVKDHGLKPENYSVGMVEFHPQAYGGNIIIDEAGNIVAEFCKGGQGVIAEGRYDSRQHGTLYQVSNDPFTHTLRYSWEDSRESGSIPLRDYFYRALSSIPHEGEGVRARFRQGYYEFKLIQKPDGKIEPVFIDCRTDPILTVL